MTSDRTDTAVVQVGETPTWLIEHVEKDTSLDQLREYRVLPVARIVQGLSDEALKAKHGEGAWLMMPGEVKLADRNEWVAMVPVFMFTEFRKYSDRKDTTQPPVMSRDFDKSGEIAARARNVERRDEPYGDAGFKYSYTEVLCFVCCIYDGPNAGNVCVIEFQKGSFWQGQSFSSACLMRKVDGQPCPLWAQVWEMSTGTKTSKGNTWWINQFRAPEKDVPAYISEEQVTFFKQQHTDLRELYSKDLIQVDANADNDMNPEAVDPDAETEI